MTIVLFGLTGLTFLAIVLVLILCSRLAGIIDDAEENLYKQHENYDYENNDCGATE
jgi:hypothetical protein